MNRCHLSIICLILSSVVITGSAQETNTNDWHPNTKLLDRAAKVHDRFIGDAGSTLAHDVKRFYQLLRDKKWHETYELRAKAFREDTPESDYLARAIKDEKLWDLANYDVLSVGFQSSETTNDVNVAILICKFTELPGYAESYSTVFWHKEDGVWKCLSAGPSRLEIFAGTRSPMIDWR